MYAVHHPELLSVVKKLVKKNNEKENFINIVDENGENALFHAIQDKNMFKIIIFSDIDINHKNNQEDTILLYCCKHDLTDCIYELIKFYKVNVEITDREGKTAFIYLLEHKQVDLLSYLLSKKKFTVNNTNKVILKDLISLFVKKYYDIYSSLKSTDASILKKYVQHFIKIVNYPGFDINFQVDDDGNTLIMFFIMIGDIPSLGYLLSNFSETLDLSIKNKYGVSASLLIPYINSNEYYLIKYMINHPTFDYLAVDSCGNNIFIHAIVNDNSIAFTCLLKKNSKGINQINNRKENAFIVATKLGFLKYFTDYYLKEVNMNQQDQDGNTAFYYSIKLYDKYAINLLSYYHADIELRNNRNISPLDLLEEMIRKEKKSKENEMIKKEEYDNNTIIEYNCDIEEINNIIKNPLPIKKMEIKENKGKDNKIFLISHKKKRKNNDKKIEKYIQHYQIENYRKEYQYIKGKVITYNKVDVLIPLLEEIAYIYYDYTKRKNFIPMKIVDPEKKELYLY